MGMVAGSLGNAPGAAIGGAAGFMVMEWMYYEASKGPADTNPLLQKGSTGTKPPAQQVTPPGRGKMRMRTAQSPTTSEPAGQGEYDAPPPPRPPVVPPPAE